jgi:hypothetical protein
MYSGPILRVKNSANSRALSGSPHQAMRRLSAIAFPLSPLYPASLDHIPITLGIPFMGYGRMT